MIVEMTPMMIVNLTMLMGLIGVAITMILLLHTAIRVCEALNHLNNRTDLLLYLQGLKLKEKDDDA